MKHFEIAMMVWKRDICKADFEEGDGIALELQFPIGQRHVLCGKCGGDILKLAKEKDLVKLVK